MDVLEKFLGDFSEDFLKESWGIPADISGGISEGFPGKNPDDIY